MCGRTGLHIDRVTLEERFDARVVTDGGYKPRYNIAPGSDLEVITNEAVDEIDQHHWGLIPFWEDEPSEGIINARSETVDEKQPFKKAWESNPCLVLSSGFYEWKSTPKGKQPYRIHRRDDPAFAMAGVWDVWSNESEEIPCVTILTTRPNELMEPIHDRMPVILSHEEEQSWLDADAAERKSMCEPYQNDDLEAYEISTKVNNPATDDASIIEELGSEQSGLGDFTD